MALALLLVAVLGAGAAYFCWTKAGQAADAPPDRNIAFVDPLTTAGVRDQVSKAIEASTPTTRRSWTTARTAAVLHHRRLQRRVQAELRHRAPARPAGEGSATSTVVEAGVQSLTESRATCLSW